MKFIVILLLCVSVASAETQTNAFELLSVPEKQQQPQPQSGAVFIAAVAIGFTLIVGGIVIKGVLKLMNNWNTNMDNTCTNTTGLIQLPEINGVVGFDYTDRYSLPLIVLIQMQRMDGGEWMDIGCVSAYNSYCDQDKYWSVWAEFVDYYNGGPTLFGKAEIPDEVGGNYLIIPGSTNQSVSHCTGYPSGAVSISSNRLKNLRVATKSMNSIGDNGMIFRATPIQ